MASMEAGLLVLTSFVAGIVAHAVWQMWHRGATQVGYPNKEGTPPEHEHEHEQSSPELLEHPSEIKVTLARPFFPRREARLTPRSGLVAVPAAPQRLARRSANPSPSFACSPASLEHDLEPRGVPLGPGRRDHLAPIVVTVVADADAQHALDAAA